ncbi:MAG: hypothetical protein R3B49_04120 [Phycisphaerales bacterium]
MCDPRDKSELVLPLYDAEGRVLGVLDVDSHDRDAFGEHDAAGVGSGFWRRRG